MYKSSIFRNVRIPMRDEVQLAADIYRPCDPSTLEVIKEPLPVLLIRTPYDKILEEPDVIVSTSLQ